MTRTEFLARLREALESELDRRAVQENIDYYNSYITEETEKGKPESEVIAELGDPWVIARSIIGMAENSTYTQDVSGESSGRSGGSEEKSGRFYGENIHTFSLGPWWKTVLFVLGIIGVFLIVITVIGGIFSLLMPVIVPVLLIVIIFRLVGGKRR